MRETEGKSLILKNILLRATLANQNQNFWSTNYIAVSGGKRRSPPTLQPTHHLQCEASEKHSSSRWSENKSQRWSSRVESSGVLVAQFKASPIIHETTRNFPIDGVESGKSFFGSEIVLANEIAMGMMERERGVGDELNLITEGWEKGLSRDVIRQTFLINNEIKFSKLIGGGGRVKVKSTDALSSAHHLSS